MDLDHAAQTLSGIIQLLSQLDPTTREHSERLANLAKEFGEFLGLSEAEVQALFWCGYLHDIGKVAIPTDILLKPDRLTPEEWAVMKQHTEIGELLCQPFHLAETVTQVIRHHHEHWDGTGYPDGLAGEEIPLLARIVQVVDIYDALTHRRSYKAVFTPSEAVAILIEEMLRGWYQPELIQQFLDFLSCKMGLHLPQINSDLCSLSYSSPFVPELEWIFSAAAPEVAPKVLEGDREPHPPHSARPISF